MANSILQFEGKVWSTADLLIGAGIKQSDFPKYMMPFFALLMVESRLIREAERLEKEVGRSDIEDFIEMFNLEGLGYNDFVIRKKKTLKTICQNDKTFDVDFHSYLKAFDNETKYLLGVDKGTEEEKFLDISGITGQLKKKRILFDTVKAWSEIDLTPFNNSEITTLEEHIKRKWADISAETAGEQYTPDDIISLISEIIATKIENNGKFLTIYDPTCGGGNLLFGVEDKIQEKYPNRPTATYGQEWNGTLFALAKIESRFRKDTAIEYGNTLTDIGKFWDKTFNVIVANPPYGVDWKGYEKDIKNDTTERFVALPSISDGQFLFTQHILHKLADDGMSIVVHNGSTLFSGDAGSGESNIRKHFFEKDWVEAIVQMPTDEFFNTGIYTYLWIFNKNKPGKRKNKVMLINASELYIPLKKSKGKKRKEMDLHNRKKIVKALTNFKNNEFAKVFDKWHFYYNRQSIMLTNIDENGKAIQMPVKTNDEGEETEEKSIKLVPLKIKQTDDERIEIREFDITTFDKTKYKNLEKYFEEGIKPLIEELDYKEKDLTVTTADCNFFYDSEKDTLIKQTKKKKIELGCGKIVIKASLKKDSKTKQVKSISITAELIRDLQKDFEIIAYHPNEATNQKNIANFMSKYVSKPFEYKENTIGVEINFNKVFYIPEKLRDIATITKALNALEKELSNLKKRIGVMKKYSKYKPTDIAWIGDIPFNWTVQMFKQISYMKGRIGWQGLKYSEFSDDLNLPYLITGMNFKGGKIRWNEVYHISEERYNEAPEIQLKVNDILMTKDGTIGKLLFVDYLPGKASLNSHLLVLRTLKKKYYAKYLYYQLASQNFFGHIEYNKYGTTFYSLTQEAMGRFMTILPSIEEQTKIALYLDTKTQAIDEKINLLTKKVISYKELRKSVINDCVCTGLNKKAKLKESEVGVNPVHWRIGRLKDISKTMSSGATPHTSIEAYYENGILNWVNTGDLNDGVINECQYKISEVAIRDYPNLKVNKVGTLLIAMYGATICKIGLLNIEATTNQACCCINFKKDSYSKFIFYWFLANKSRIISLSVGGTQPNISQGIIARLLIAIPPIQEQTSIANYLDKKTQKIDAIVNNIGKQIDTLKELRKTFINVAVTGKIKVVNN